MPNHSRFAHCCRTALLSLLVLLSGLSAAQAGVSFQMTQNRAEPGQAIQIQSILFNDTDNALHDKVPPRLTLEWLGRDGKRLTSTAYREAGNGRVNLPVNNFMQFTWHTVVPTGATGLQAVSVKDQQAGMMALEVGDTPTQNPGGTAVSPSAPAAMPVEATTGSATGSPTRGADTTATQNSATQEVRVQPSAFENFRSAISSFEPIYFDLGDNDGANARFQLSFKYRLFTPEDPRNPGFLDHLYFGYTQTSLWDLHDNSVPFVDTTYNPSLFWHKDKMWQTNDQRWYTGLATGVEHKSNGKGGDDSRSLNDVFVQPELNYRFNNGSTLTFSPRVKAYFLDNQNPDYSSYLGRVDWKLRWAQDDGLVLDALYQQGHHGRHAVQLEAAWPLQRTFLHMNGYLHVQFYQGYGETLLGYNLKADPQVRVGLSLVP